MSRNFVKILHQLADYLRCLWYVFYRNSMLERVWIFFFSPVFPFFLFFSSLFFFFSVTDSLANSRVTQWSRRWRTCVIGRNSFHAIYMPRKLRVCAAYISRDPLFRWQRLSSRRWAVVPISDDSGWRRPFHARILGTDAKRWDWWRVWGLFEIIRPIILADDNTFFFETMCLESLKFSHISLKIILWI